MQIILVLSYLVIKVKGDLKQVSIEALDCRFPTHIQSGLVNKICSNDNANIMKPGLNKTKVILLQQSTKRVIKGYRCEKYYSVFTEVCGMFSHTKLYSPPKIKEPQLITSAECQGMRDTLTYKREDDSLAGIQLNQIYQYQFVRHGQLHYSATNVACEGATITVHGEQVSNIVELISAEVIIKAIEIETDIVRALDLDRNVPLPTTCAHERQCQVGTEAYLMVHPESACPLSVIRTADMNLVKLQSDDGEKDALIDHQDKILLTLVNKEIAPTACRPIFSMYQTEFSNLKVVTEDIALAAVSNIVKHFDASLLDLDLEIRTSESYLTYYFQEVLFQQMKSVTSKICTVSSHSLELNELSPFHPDSLLRVRGDIIQELRCKRVIAVARIGETRNEKCSSDSLPVWVDNQPVRIQSRTHLVVDEDPLEMIPCNAAYMPVFLAKDGKTMLTANPEVQLTKIPLGHLEEDYLHLTDTVDLKHPNFGKDLLYTKEEMEQFNELIHFQRTKKRVINALITDYCEANDQCGTYSPTSGTSTAFNLQHLEDKIYSPFEIFFDWSEKLTKIGNVCSIFIVLLLVASIVYKISKVFWLTFRHNLGFRQAVKLGLFVDTTLMKALVEATPTEHHQSRPLPPEPEQIPLHPFPTSHPAPEPMPNTNRAVVTYRPPTSEPWY